MLTTTNTRCRRYFWPGQTFFYQSELPYIVNQDEFGAPGYAGYRVTPSVKTHNAYGVGVYCFFSTNKVVVQSGIVCPEPLVSSFINPLTVWLNGVPGSGKGREGTLRCFAIYLAVYRSIHHAQPILRALFYSPPSPPWLWLWLLLYEYVS